jgi:hypothetical protein
VEKFDRTGEALDNNTMLRRKIKIKFACRITKATIQTHRQNITFPQQLWLDDRASTLRLPTLPVLSDVVSNNPGCMASKAVMIRK